jgi:predicted nucleic acid-binding protein
VTAHDQGLLDTSVIIVLERLDASRTLPRVSLISTITLAELSVGPLVSTAAAESIERQVRLQWVESDFDPLPFDSEAARAFGSVAASYRRRGRKTSSRAFDAMIAAVAIANGLPLYTCNPRDFEGIEGLEVVPVEVPR